MVVVWRMGFVSFVCFVCLFVCFVLRTTSVSPLDRDKDTLSLTREKCWRIFRIFYEPKISLHCRRRSRIGMFCGHFFSHAPQPMHADAVSPVSHGFFPMEL